MNEEGKTNMEDDEIIIDEKVIGEDGEVRIKTHCKGNILGKGGFAKCFELIDMETNTLYACKTVSKESLTKGKAKEKVFFILNRVVDIRDRDS